MWKRPFETLLLSINYKPKILPIIFIIFIVLINIEKEGSFWGSLFSIFQSIRIEPGKRKSERKKRSCFYPFEIKRALL